jgi:TonB-like protein
LRAPLSRKPLGARSLIVAAAALGAIVLVLRGDDAHRRSGEKAMKRYEAAHPGVLRVGGDVKAPKLISKVEPNWESIPKEKRIQRGPIIVEAVISTKGEVVDPTVVGEPQPNLDAVFLSALRQWRYAPARRGGETVAVFLVITVMFDAGA